MTQTLVAKARVSIFESTLPLLLAQRQFSEEPLAAVIHRLSKASDGTVRLNHKTQTVAANSGDGRHVLEFMGDRIAANSYGKLFARLVDIVEALDPSVLVRLAAQTPRTRHYVSKIGDEIHDGRADLPTFKTQSGYYVSLNIGKRDFRRALRAMCSASSLVPEVDMRLLK